MPTLDELLGHTLDANTAKMSDLESIFSTKDIKKGEKFSKNNIRVIRPGYGLAPKYYDQILNKKSPINISKNEPLKSNVLKGI